jgi:hypothetical protein
MSASHFGTTFWLDDYWGSYFQPESGGGAIIGALSGSFAGTATFSGTIEQPAQSVRIGSVGGVSKEDVARIRRFLKREKEPITKLYKKLVAVKRHVPEASKAELIKAGDQYAKEDKKPLSLDWLNFELILKHGDQERMKSLINNAILAAEIARAEDEDDEDTLLLLYG